MVRAMNYIASIFCTFVICHSPQKSSAVQKVYRRPLRRCAPALPEGEPLAKRRGFTVCQSLSLWERWQCEALRERASPSPESRHAAISCLFGRAMLSLRPLFFVSVLALSVTFGDSSPKGGATGMSVRPHSLRGVLFYQKQKCSAVQIHDILTGIIVQKPLFLTTAHCILRHICFQRSAQSFPACQSLSPWERWHCEAMTERAGPV